MILKTINLKKLVILGTLILVISSIIAYNIVSSNSNEVPNSATLVKRLDIGVDNYE